MKREELISKVVQEGERKYSSPYVEEFVLNVAGREFRVVLRRALGGRKLPPILQEKREGKWEKVALEEIGL